MSGIGHNSAVDPTTAAQLLQYIERAERLLEERQGINDDVRDVMLEAKSVGFDVKTIKKMIALRKKDKDSRDEEQALFETYAAAIGLI